MEWYEILIDVIVILIGILGLFFGLSAVYKVKQLNSSQQKNKFGDNVIKQGFTAEDLSLIIKTMDKQTYFELKMQLEKFKEEYESQPRIHSKKVNK